MSDDSGEREARLRSSLERSGVFLVGEMGGRLNRFARSRGLDEAAAEDAVQEALAAAFAHRREVVRLEPWLVRVVARRCSDWHRRRSAADPHLERDAAERTRTHSAPSSDRIDLSRALSSLPYRQRLALRLRYVEGLSSDEAAERMGYTAASYRTTLGRTLSSLRTLLGISCRKPSTSD